MIAQKIIKEENHVKLHSDYLILLQQNKFQKINLSSKCVKIQI